MCHTLSVSLCPNGGGLGSWVGFFWMLVTPSLFLSALTGRAWLGARGRGFRTRVTPSLFLSVLSAQGVWPAPSLSPCQGSYQGAPRAKAPRHRQSESLTPPSSASPRAMPHRHPPSLPRAFVPSSSLSPSFHPSTRRFERSAGFQHKSNRSAFV